MGPLWELNEIMHKHLVLVQRVLLLLTSGPSQTLSLFSYSFVRAKKDAVNGRLPLYTSLVYGHTIMKDIIVLHVPWRLLLYFLWLKFSLIITFPWFSFSISVPFDSSTIIKCLLCVRHHTKHQVEVTRELYSWDYLSVEQWLEKGPL